MRHFIKIIFLALLTVSTAACVAGKSTSSADKSSVPDASKASATQEGSAAQDTPGKPAKTSGNITRIKSDSDLEAVKKKAAAGDVQAKASLAIYYYNMGEPIDVELAVQNAKEAAEAGSVEGKYILGAILLYSRDDMAAKTGLAVTQEAME